MSDNNPLERWECLDCDIPFLFTPKEIPERCPNCKSDAGFTRAEAVLPILKLLEKQEKNEHEKYLKALRWVALLWELGNFGMATTNAMSEDGELRELLREARENDKKKVKQ